MRRSRQWDRRLDRDQATERCGCAEDGIELADLEGGDDGTEDEGAGAPGYDPLQRRGAEARWLHRGGDGGPSARHRRRCQHAVLRDSFCRADGGCPLRVQCSGRQSRLSLLAEGKLPSATLRAYYETDFLSAGTTSNDNQSNSYPLRLRQAWAQMDFNSGWTITAGQMWSLATEYRHGLVNNAEAIPLTIDAQYNVGFTWERQYGFRVAKHFGDKLWLGGAVEESQTLNIGGHNLPTIAYQQAGNAGGLYNPTANYSFNYAPDLIAKIAYEPAWGHFEVFGIGRFFRDRVFPNGPTPPGAPPGANDLCAGGLHLQGAGRRRWRERAHYTLLEEAGDRRAWPDRQWPGTLQHQHIARCDRAS